MHATNINYFVGDSSDNDSTDTLVPLCDIQVPPNFLLPDFQELSAILPVVDEDDIFSTCTDHQSIRDMWLNYIKSFLRDQPDSSDRYSLIVALSWCLSHSLCMHACMHAALSVCFQRNLYGKH